MTTFVSHEILHLPNTIVPTEMMPQFYPKVVHNIPNHLISIVIKNLHAN